VRFGARDGELAIDASGRLPGRGAYVCGEDCYETARKRNAFNRALKSAVQVPAHAGTLWPEPDRL
jgi:predicted RNA-binding protein YlxR (DUF448 family)